MNKIKCEKCGYTHNSIDDLQPGFKGMLTCYRCYANVCKKPEEMLIVTDKDRAFAVIKATDPQNTDQKEIKSSKQTYTKMQSPDLISDIGIYKEGE